MQAPVWPQLLGQAALLALSAFFTYAGALLRAGETPLRRQEDERRAVSDRILAALRLGAMLCAFLGAGLAARDAAARLPGALFPGGDGRAWLPGVCGGLAAGVLAPVYFVFGEWLPGRWARRRAGTAPSGAAEESERAIAELGEEHGEIENGEREMVENIIDFNNMTAEDVMVHRTDMTMLWVGDTDEEIVRTIEETGLSRYPVYDEDADDVIGILNSRAYFLNARLPRPRSVREILRQAYFVPETVRADALFRDMQSKKIHMAIVVDEYGGTSGLVTLEDLLEEIVGKIYDEFDPQDEQEIIRLGENQWRIAGSADLEEVGEALGVEFPDDAEAETLGGLVLFRLSVIPENGSHPEVDAYGLHIRVEHLAERRVEWALVSRLPEGAADA